MDHRYRDAKETRPLEAVWPEQVCHRPARIHHAKGIRQQRQRRLFLFRPRKHKDEFAETLRQNHPGDRKPILNRASLCLTRDDFQLYPVLWPVELGALTQLYAATEPSALQYKGGYLCPWARVEEPHQGTKDEAEQKKLWDYCHDALKPWLE